MWFVILIAIVGIIYLASMQGITCCNSGSSFALVRAITEKRKLSINEFIKYTKYIDYTKRRGKYYTDRPPGLAFAAVPIHFLRLNVTLIPVISGVLSTALVYLITMQLVNNPLIAFFTGLIFAFCTINWRYSTIFIMHPLSTFLVLFSVYGVINNYHPLLIGLILGISTMVEYTNFMYFFGICLGEFILGNLFSIPFLVLGYSLGIIPLLVYNKKCFSSPFATSYKYSAYFKWSNSPKTTFITPLLKGALGLLFFIPKKDNIRFPGGILALSPILLFGFIGYYYLPYKILILFLCVSLPIFLLVSKHKTWWGGGARDYRYLSSMIPYITIPIGLSMKNLYVLWPLMLLLSLLSLAMIISRIILLTISIDDLKKIDPIIAKEIRKRKVNLFAILKIKNMKKILILAFQGLFIKKIKFEDFLRKKIEIQDIEAGY